MHLSVDSLVRSGGAAINGKSLRLRAKLATEKAGRNSFCLATSTAASSTSLLKIFHNCNCDTKMTSSEKHTVQRPVAVDSFTACVTQLSRLFPGSGFTWYEGRPSLALGARANESWSQTSTLSLGHVTYCSVAHRRLQNRMKGVFLIHGANP